MEDNNYKTALLAMTISAIIMVLWLVLYNLITN